MNLAKFSIRRPVTAGILSATLLILGIYFQQGLPVSLYPDVSFPFVGVTLQFPGASPEQVESRLIKPLENEFSGIRGLNRLMSFARPGGGQVILAFKMHINDKEAADAVRERVAAVRGKFPSGVKEPTVRRIDVGATPVLIFGVESQLSREKTAIILNDGLIAAMKRVDGVNDVTLDGSGDERLELRLNPDRLTGLRVPPLDIFEQLTAKLSVLPWGDVADGRESLPLARRPLSDDPEFWERLEVNLRDGRGVRLGDLGVVTKARDEKAPQIYVNGKEGFGITVTKRADANTVATVDEVKKVLHRLGVPEGVKLFPIIDQSQFIKENAKEVWIALFVGGAFAILIILLFLTDMRSALISATALPVSVGGTFIFMHYLGFSVNMLTLLALALAIGLLIDDAVVVREAIYSEMEKGLRGEEAAVVGTNKVIAPVLATTFAVIAVFLPVAMMSGLVGQFFRQFGITICIAVLISAWVAFTLDPMLSARYAGEPRPLKGKIWNRWRQGLLSLEHAIGKWAAWAYRWPLLVIFASIAMLTFSLYLTGRRGGEFLASEDRSQFIVSLRGKSGSLRSENLAYAEEAARKLREIPEVKDTFAEVGTKTDERLTTMRVVLQPKNERKKGLIQLQDEARKKLAGIQANWLVLDPPPIEGIGGEPPLTVYVQGQDLIGLEKVAESVRAKIAALPGVAGARIESYAASSGLGLQFSGQDLAVAGSGAQAVDLTGRLAVSGLEPGSVGDENIPFIVRIDPQYLNLNALWNGVYVPTLKGPMTLGSFVDAQKEVRPSAIDRENRGRKLTIWGSLDRSVTYGVILKQVEKIVKDVPAPFTAGITGDKEFFEELQTSFSTAMLGSLFFIFIILAVQFENLLRPFVILLSLPLALIGGFLALNLANQQLAIGSIIGLVLLIGLAAKNGILLVDAIGQKSTSDMSLPEAVALSVQERSRPILMTSMAMIFGMMPTAVMQGGGAEFRAPMAIAIIGGVISSTLLSFLVVPAIFGLIGRYRKTKERRKRLRSTPSLVAVALGMFLWPSLFPKASAFSMADQDQWPKADMGKVRTLLKAINPQGPESLRTEGARIAAEGSSDASILAFLGGAKISVSRQWTRPGAKQSFDATLPFPPPTGPVRIHQETTVVPTRDDTWAVGWGIPLINLQAIYGRQLANQMNDQLPIVEKAQREQATTALAQAWLGFELSMQTVRISELQLKHAENRLATVSASKRAGRSRRSDELVAESQVQMAVIDLERARSDLAVQKQRLQLRLGPGKEVESLGIPQFPYQGDKPFAPIGLQILQAIHRTKQLVSEVSQAAIYPTLSFEVGRAQHRWSSDSPPAQTSMMLKAEWNLLDGGVRVRTVALEKQAALEAKADADSLALDLRASYDTLMERRKRLLGAGTAAKANLRAAKEAQDQSQQAFAAGVVTASDVRAADEIRLRAELGLLQTEFAIQALNMESMILTGSWLAYLDNS